MKLEKRLLFTERGQRWLKQFAVEVRDTAEKIVDSLTLVSHSEFERAIQLAVENVAAELNGAIAFFAAREVEAVDTFFEQATFIPDQGVNALSYGVDHGSEARIAALIRNFCKTDPDRFFNHPSIEEMRQEKCRAIVIIDDFIGSGDRVVEYINSIYADKTIKSWYSRKHIVFIVISYSGTHGGVERVSRHRVKPEVILELDCPTLNSIPWNDDLKREVRAVCYEYGKKTSQGWFWDGYGRQMCSLVFEHGCPDNAPAILWAPDEGTKPWFPLFPDRVVLAEQKSVFPPEIVRGDPLTTLLDVGQSKIAVSGQLLRRGKVGQQILLILALIAKGQRHLSALSYATGLNKKFCAEVIARCIKWGFLTAARRLTQRGNAELRTLTRTKRTYKGVLELGLDEYYPSQLRGTANG